MSIFEFNEEAEALGEKIKKHYHAHKVKIEIEYIKTKREPKRYIYEVKPLAGTRVNDLNKFEKDIKSQLGLSIFQINNDNVKNEIVIVASKKSLATKSLWDIMESKSFDKAKKDMELPLAIGCDAMGEKNIQDLEIFPHLLLAGMSRSGKSVAQQNVILSLIYTLPVGKLDLILCDTVTDSFIPFAELQHHLSCNIINDSETGFKVMRLLEKELKKRMAIKKSPNPYIRSEFKHFSYIVVVIDEFPSLIAGINNKKKADLLIGTITNLLNNSRHGKIHFVIAAQNPTRKNMGIDTGNIARMCFKTAHYNQSITIIGNGGACELMGNGDMIFQMPNGKEQRIQGAYLKPKEIKQLVEDIISDYDDNYIANIYKFRITDSDLNRLQDNSTQDFMNDSNVNSSEKDDYYKTLAQIIMYSLGCTHVSCNQMMAEFHLGYQRANRFLNNLYDLGIVSDVRAKLPRDVLAVNFEDLCLEVINLLNEKGYSSEQIKETLANKPKTYEI